MEKMKKALKILAISFLFAAIFSSFAAAAEGPRIKSTEIEIQTKDNFILNGTLYATKESKKPLIIMLHSFGQKSVNWGDIPKELYALGYNVLTMDLRGHGKSVYDVNLRYRSRNYFTDKDWAKIPSDVLETVAYMKENYPKIDCDKISFVGADLGANAAVLAGAKLRIAPQKFILISPQANFKGLYIPLVIASYQSAPIMIMVSSQDKGSMEQADLLSRFIQSPITRINYPFGGVGMLLTIRNKNATSDIVNFFKTPLP